MTFKITRSSDSYLISLLILNILLISTTNCDSEKSLDAQTKIGPKGEVILTIKLDPNQMTQQEGGSVNHNVYVHPSPAPQRITFQQHYDSIATYRDQLRLELLQQMRLDQQHQASLQQLQRYQQPYFPPPPHYHQQQPYPHQQHPYGHPPPPYYPPPPQQQQQYVQQPTKPQEPTTPSPEQQSAVLQQQLLNLQVQQLKQQLQQQSVQVQQQKFKEQLQQQLVEQQNELKEQILKEFQIKQEEEKAEQQRQQELQQQQVMATDAQGQSQYDANDYSTIRDLLQPSVIINKEEEDSKILNVASAVVKTVSQIPSGIDLLFSDMNKAYWKNIKKLKRVVQAGQKGNKNNKRRKPGRIPDYHLLGA